MNEQTTELIKTLSDKLGVASERLWGALLKQAPIAATVDLILLMTLTVGLFKAIKAWKKWEPDDCDLRAVALIPIGLLAILWFICLIQLSDILSGYFNPDYWALNKILSSIKD